MNLTTNQIIGGLVILLIVAVGSFYAGQHYTGRGVAARGGYAAGGMNMPMGQGAGFAGRTAGGPAGGRAGATGGGLVSGSIVSKDADSITVSLAGGGSEVVYLSASTSVMKSDTGSASDLAAGQNVTIMGAKNSDGSVSATSVQIRPAGAPNGPAPAPPAQPQ